MELSDHLRAQGEIEVRHYRDGALIDAFTHVNLVTDDALDLVLDTVFRAAPRPGWYFGLRGNGLHTAQDSLSSKAWAEFTAYSGNRPTFAPEAASGGVIGNQNWADFEVTGGEGIVRGAFLTDAASKDAGHTLYMVCSFGRALIVYGGDRISLRYQTSLKRAT